MNIRVLSVLIFFQLLNVPSIAQENQDNLFYLEKIEKYRKMKNGGATLTVLGGVFAVTGMGMMLNSLDILAAEQSDNYRTGGTLFVIGAICLAPGIPLWIVGAHNHRKYWKKSKDVSIRLDMNTQITGLTISYRF